ncbi:hypothetical protein BH20ACT9_BH20ACT9_15650 [soil metagenome]
MPVSRRPVLALAVGLPAAVLSVLGVEILLAANGDYLSGDPGYRVEATVGRGDAPPVRLAVVGDSTAAGVGATSEGRSLPVQVAVRVAAATGRRVRVVGYAVSGARTDTARRLQVPRLAGRRVDAVLVVVGANDVTHTTPPWVLRRRTAALLDALATTHPDAGLVLAGIPELGTVPAFAQPLRALAGAYADVLRGVQRDVAGARDGVGYVDIAREASPRFIGRPASMSPDGFHPAALGYGFWADALAPAVVDALGAPSPVTGTGRASSLH